MTFEYRSATPTKGTFAGLSSEVIWTKKGGWRTLLTERPKKFRLENLKYVGGLPYYVRQKEQTRRVNEVVHELIRKHFPDFDANAYGKSRPTFEKIENEAKRINPAPTWELDEEARAFADYTLYNYILPLGPFPLATDDEIINELLPKSPGLWYEDLHKNATKRTTCGVAVKQARGLLDGTLKDFEDSDPLFKFVGKTEILSAVKIQEKRNRNYAVPPLYLYILEIIFFHHLSNAYKEHDKGYTLTLQHGGLYELFAQMDKYGTVISDDKTGFDLRQQWIVQKSVARICAYTIDMSDKHHMMYMHLAHQFCAKNILMPDGSVFYTPYHHASGRYVTTMKGSLFHRWEQAYVFYVVMQQQTPDRATEGLGREALRLLFERMNTRIASDDVLQGVPNDPIYEPWLDQEKRTSVWETLVPIKPGSALQTHSSTGHFYLGWTVENGKVKHNSRTKLLAKLLYSSIKDKQGVITGLVHTSPYDTPMCDFLRELANKWGVEFCGQRIAQLLWRRRLDTAPFLPSPPTPEGVIMMHPVDNVHKIRNSVTMARKKQVKQAAKRKEERKIERAVERRQAVHPLRHLMTPKLHGNTYKYLETLVDPYNTPAGASTPDKVVRKSARYKSYVKTTMTTGTGGFGFCLFNPYSAAWGDQFAVATSNGTYAGTLTDPNSATAGVNNYKSTAPLNWADASANGYSCRVVGAGIRILNNTALLDMGGSVTGIREPGNQYLTGYTFADILNYNQCHVIRPEAGKWIHVEWAPTGNIGQETGDQFEFDDENPASAASMIGGQIAIVATSAGPAANAQSYDVEAVVIYEMLGEKLPLQDVHVDPLGQAACLEVIAELDGSASDKWITQVGKVAKRTGKALREISAAAMPAALMLGLA